MERTIKLTLEYDGAAYHGWQRQGERPTVQGEVEKALARMTGASVTVHGSGRTDAGVHALAQVAHFRLETRLSPAEFLRGLNSLLPFDISVTHCEEAAPDFHARKSALGKTYAYHVLNAPVRSALGRRYAWHVPRPLDLSAMREAARRLVGTHDFAAFEGAGSPRAHTVRTVTAADFSRTGDLLVFSVSADGFLRCMVRNMAGTLVFAGLGKIAPEEVTEILASRDRRRAGPTAPPQGLFLVEVRYRLV